MTPKSGPPSELLEPLQTFLQSFTQELTEQQFVPAFREELRRVIAAIDNLQQSEESLQQIARGVERLREVFAPAGTRLLEGVKDFENIMRSNAADLRDRSGQVLKDLLSTHDQLEAALRNEAGLLQEQTSASREALTRTIADVEGRLFTLTATIETICRKMETGTAELMVAAPKRSGKFAAAPSAAVASGSVTVHIPDDVRELLVRTEATLNVELERHRKEFLSAIHQSTQHQEERLARVDHSVERVVSSVGPRVQEEMDQALLRLEERLQSRFLTGLPAVPLTGQPEKGGSKTPHVTPEMTSGIFAVAENRLLGEFAALRKALRNDQEAAAKFSQDLAHDIEETSRKQAARVTEETKNLNESILNLHRLAESVANDERQSREQLTAIQSALQSSSTQGSRETLELLRSQSELLTRKVDEDRHLLAQLSASISRAEQASTTATERAHAESRTLREKIDASLKELAERMQRDVVAETDRVQDTLRQLAQAWQSELSVLREDISQLTKEAGTTLTANLRQLQSQIEDKTRNDQNAHRELKEAIRANYDESVVRLSEIVEGGYDKFIKQIATIPQALERHASLVQSLHQSDQLALQSIGSDTKNIVGLATQKFDVLVTDSSAIKKFFPLLDRKVEKHTAELDAIRKSQAKHDKELGDLKTALVHTVQKNDAQGRELKDEIRGFQRDTSNHFQGTVQSLADVRSDLKALLQEDLPAFRREFATLLSTKFDMMEATTRDRQDALRSEIDQRLDSDQKYYNRIFILLGLLTVLGIAVQISAYVLTH